jgi:hypothetical protein
MPPPAPFTMDLRARAVGDWIGPAKNGVASRVSLCPLCSKPGVAWTHRGNLSHLHVISNEGREQSCFVQARAKR